MVSYALSLAATLPVLGLYAEQKPTPSQRAARGSYEDLFARVQAGKVKSKREANRSRDFFTLCGLGRARAQAPLVK